MSDSSGGEESDLDDDIIVDKVIIRHKYTNNLNDCMKNSNQIKLESNLTSDEDSNEDEESDDESESDEDPKQNHPKQTSNLRNTTLKSNSKPITIDVSKSDEQSDEEESEGESESDEEESEGESESDEEQNNCKQTSDLRKTKLNSNSSAITANKSSKDCEPSAKRQRKSYYPDVSSPDQKTTAILNNIKAIIVSLKPSQKAKYDKLKEKYEKNRRKRVKTDLEKPEKRFELTPHLRTCIKSVLNRKVEDYNSLGESRGGTGDWSSVWHYLTNFTRLQIFPMFPKDWMNEKYLSDELITEFKKEFKLLKSTPEKSEELKTDEEEDEEEDEVEDEEESDDNLLNKKANELNGKNRANKVNGSIKMIINQIKSKSNEKSDLDVVEDEEEDEEEVEEENEEEDEDEGEEESDGHKQKQSHRTDAHNLKTSSEKTKESKPKTNKRSELEVKSVEQESDEESDEEDEEESKSGEEESESGEEESESGEEESESGEEESESGEEESESCEEEEELDKTSKTNDRKLKQNNWNKLEKTTKKSNEKSSEHSEDRNSRAHKPLPVITDSNKSKSDKSNNNQKNWVHISAESLKLLSSKETPKLNKVLQRIKNLSISLETTLKLCEINTELKSYQKPFKLINELRELILNAIALKIRQYHDLLHKSYGTLRSFNLDKRVKQYIKIFYKTIIYPMLPNNYKISKRSMRKLMNRFIKKLKSNPNYIFESQNSDSSASDISNSSDDNNEQMDWTSIPNISSEITNAFKATNKLNTNSKSIESNSNRSETIIVEKREIALTVNSETQTDTQNETPEKQRSVDVENEIKLYTNSIEIQTTSSEAQTIISGSDCETIWSEIQTTEVSQEIKHFLCIFCLTNTYFLEKSQAKEHYRQHMNVVIKCEICFASYNNPNRFQEHSEHSLNEKNLLNIKCYYLSLDWIQYFLSFQLTDRFIELTRIHKEFCPVCKAVKQMDSINTNRLSNKLESEDLFAIHLRKHLNYNNIYECLKCRQMKANEHLIRYKFCFDLSEAKNHLLSEHKSDFDSDIISDDLIETNFEINQTFGPNLENQMKTFIDLNRNLEHIYQNNSLD